MGDLELLSCPVPGLPKECWQCWGLCQILTTFFKIGGKETLLSTKWSLLYDQPWASAFFSPVAPMALVSMLVLLMASASNYVSLILIQGMQQNKILLCSKQLAYSSQMSIVVFSGDSVSKSFQSIQPPLSSPSPSSFLPKTRAQWNQKWWSSQDPVALSVLIQSQCLLLQQEAARSQLAESCF